MARQRTNVLNLAEFMERNRLTRAQFKWLIRNDQAPATITVKGKVYVSRRAEQYWLRAMEGTASTAVRRPIKRRLVRA